VTYTSFLPRNSLQFGVNRSLAKPDLSMLLSHYDRRSAQWSRHTQFLADTEIDTLTGPVVEQFRKHAPHFTGHCSVIDVQLLNRSHARRVVQTQGRSLYFTKR
jgi:hypothetical protein